MIEIQPRWRVKGNIATVSWLVFVNGKLAGTKSFVVKTRSKKVGLVMALADCLGRLDPDKVEEISVVMANKALCNVLFKGEKCRGHRELLAILDQHRDLLNSFVLVPSNKTGRVVA